MSFACCLVYARVVFDAFLVSFNLAKNIILAGVKVCQQNF